MNLHKLPKDILIEIIKKNFDFSKLSVEQVENIHSEISKAAKKRYLNELNKNRKILETKYDGFDIEVKYWDGIRVGDLKIKLYFTEENKYELKYYEYGYELKDCRRFAKYYNTQEELIQHILHIHTNIPERVDEFVSIIKTLINALQNNYRIEAIIDQNFVDNDIY